MIYQSSKKVPEYPPYYEPYLRNEIDPEIRKLIDEALIRASKPETKEIFEILKKIREIIT